MAGGGDEDNRAGAVAPLIKTALFTVLVPGVVAGLVPYWIVSSAPRGLALGPWRYLGLPFMTLGALGYFWCAWNFAVTGRGTPAPIDPPKRLVIHGPYRYVRNPMYLSVVSVLVGEAVWYEASSVLLYAGVFVVAVNLFVLLYEEPFLRQQFGTAYEEYCCAVPRWLPRWRGK
ncbi:MAG: methyltransferase family protein [Candidatus Acidiferrales bacterium]